MKSNMPKNGAMTLEKLAIMVQKGFNATATKEDLNELKEELNAFKEEMCEFKEETRGRFSGLGNRLDAIEMEIIDMRKKLGGIIYPHT